MNELVAVSNASLGVAKILIEKGAQINHRDAGHYYYHYHYHHSFVKFSYYDISLS
jgi:hypothetical protein